MKNAKVKSGKELIFELQKLFAAMCMGSKKYLDPSAVLTSIVDDVGEKFKIGEEKDMQEFNDMFLSRIQDAQESQDKKRVKSPQKPMP